jgi:hypothetical protein
MLTAFFMGKRLLTVQAFPEGRKFNQDCFPESLLPVLTDEKRYYARKYRGAKVLSTRTTITLTWVKDIAEMERQDGPRALQPPHSLNIGPWDFGYLGL